MLSNPPIILVVEDDKLIQDLIEKWLSILGVELHFASNGLEGVRKYEDVRLQGINPVEFILEDVAKPHIGPEIQLVRASC